MIAMHARPRHTDRKTDEHHGNSAPIGSSNEWKKLLFGYLYNLVRMCYREA